MMTTPPSDTGGFVYLVVNPAWPGRVKVGKTSEPSRRLRNYQTASPKRDYAFVACLWFPNRHTAEERMKKVLGTDHEWAESDSYFAAERLKELHKEIMKSGH